MPSPVAGTTRPPAITRGVLHVQPPFRAAREDDVLIGRTLEGTLRPHRHERVVGSVEDMEVLVAGVAGGAFPAARHVDDIVRTGAAHLQKEIAGYGHDEFLLYRFGIRDLGFRISAFSADS